MSLRVNMQPLSIIVAVDKYGGFGKDGKIPWSYPEDLKHFKEVTQGGVCIMGRKTYNDILAMVKRRRKKNKTKGKITEILPGRQSFVVTSNPKFKAPGATVVSSIREAVQSLDEEDSRDVFVIGGYRMFVEALNWATTVYMTVIDDDKEYQCDITFPINTIVKKFSIVEGTEEGNLRFMTYKRSSM